MHMQPCNKINPLHRQLGRLHLLFIEFAGESPNIQGCAGFGHAGGHSTKSTYVSHIPAENVVNHTIVAGETALSAWTRLVDARADWGVFDALKYFTE